MKEIRIFIAIITIMASSGTSAQVAINSNGSAPASSAMLDVQDTTRGVLLPRLTNAQRDASASPATGLVIYNTENKALQIYNGASWELILDWKCGDPFLDTVNNHVYRTVLIGSQCWFVENLKAYRYNDGTPIIYEGILTSSPRYCWYNHDSATSPNTYGGLYNWYAVNTGSLCPAGWHVPSDTEWDTLIDTLGGLLIAGGKLKESGLLHWNSPNAGATNEMGFTALPGGTFNKFSTFSSLGECGYHWSATSESSTRAWLRTINSDNAWAQLIKTYKTEMLSVRCLKD